MSADLRYYRARAADGLGPVEVDGAEFGSAMRRFRGPPTAEQLADPRLEIKTLAGLPWPGSISDGRGAAGLNPNAMAVRLARGAWPDEEEVELQASAMT